jgi:hypothetical protein
MAFNNREEKERLTVAVAEVFYGVVCSLVELSEELRDDGEKAAAELHEDRNDNGENENILSRRLSRLIF